ncbi:hypothetical protein F4678DRAFT_113352 [Xylaria arbuscula]|nr:hypothetical protein F4678DRAFT_113352 [Xylaria arbuscula]
MMGSSTHAWLFWFSVRAATSSWRLSCSRRHRDLSLPTATHASACVICITISRAMELIEAGSHSKMIGCSVHLSSYGHPSIT